MRVDRCESKQMFQGAKTAGAILADTRNPGGFDYLRLVLSVGVLAFHCVTITEGRSGELAVWDSAWRALPAAILPVFFALSGFLVAGSVLRSSLSNFVLSRVFRIVPALATEVLLSAIVLGLCVSTLPVGAYVRGPEFWQYFLNIIGWIHFRLPGVFEGNPTSGIVNLSLWTVPYELECYLALVGALVVGLVHRARLFLGLLLGLHVAVLLWDLVRKGSLGVAESMPPRVLVLSFLSGVVLYLWRDRLVISGGRFLAAVIASAVLLTFPLGAYLVSLPVAYVTICIGLTNPKRHWIVTSGDYSYGVYLYAFPIQQTLVHLWPQLSAVEVFLMATPLAFMAAMFSWHVIEKPCLALRHSFVARPPATASATAAPAG